VGEDVSEYVFDDSQEPRTNAVFASWPYTALKIILAISLFGMAAITFVDVVGRYVFSAPIPGTFEIVGLLMGVVTFTALPLITRTQGHITVDLFDNLIRGRARRVQQFSILAGSALVMAFFAERLWSTAIDEYRSNFVTNYFGISRAPLLIVLSALSAATCAILLIMLWQYVTGRAETRPPGGGPAGIDPADKPGL